MRFQNYYFDLGMLKNDVFSFPNHRMKGFQKELLQQGGVILFFIVLSLVFFSPVLKGEALYQSDIGQYKGMSKERNDYKEQTGIESYWTNNAFGGMPTYQLGANYPHDYIKRLDRLVRFLPRPADYLFLYFLGFYLFMISLKVQWRWAVLGALAYGFSTYLIIILEVGHNAKAHALGYAPVVLAGLIWLFKGRHLLGVLVFTLGMAFEISANHYQMTYYIMLLLGVYLLIEAYRSFTAKNGRSYLIRVGLLFAGLLLAIGTNATGILATQEYADWSTRGKSALELKPDGQPKESNSGLDKEYITQYSYGITESLNILVPRLFGGSNGENLGRESHTYAFLEARAGRRQAAQFAEALPLYWGDQPIVAAPAYVGAVVFFLFLLGLFTIKGPVRLWLGLGVLFSLLLSWGKNFELLTNLMIDYFPLYNKFRAVSSIQVILELCMPALGILGLYQFFKGELDEQSKRKALFWSGGISAGILLILFVFKGSFSFEGASDDAYLQAYGPEFMAAIEKDRRAVYNADLWRSFAFIGFAFGLLWISIKQKGKEVYWILAFGLLFMIDLYGVARRYLTDDDFVNKRRINTPFVESEADRQIQQDKSHYRVFDLNEGLNGARTNFFHKSVGGYHAAKPASLNELFEYQIKQGNTDALDMLNVKYLMQRGEDGQRIAQVNPAAFGNAWFVDSLIPTSSADELMVRMKSVNLRNTAVGVASDGIQEATFDVDSTATIELTAYKPNELVYKSANEQAGYAVFSELWYPKGWIATINGQEVAIQKVNHALRGILVPAGENTIAFRFEPEVVKKGSTISLIASLLVFLVLVYGLGQSYLPERFRLPPWLVNSSNA